MEDHSVHLTYHCMWDHSMHLINQVHATEYYDPGEDIIILVQIL